MHRTRTLIGIGAAALLALLPASVAAAPAQASSPSSPDRSCARSFDATVRQYVESTHQRDVDAFAEVLHDDLTVIFGDGEILHGKAATMEFIEEFFADPTWTQSFTEVTRKVEGCRTGFVLWDSIYEVPSRPYRAHFMIGVTFTREHGRWLALHNQDSKLAS